MILGVCGVLYYFCLSGTLFAWRRLSGSLVFTRHIQVDMESEFQVSLVGDRSSSRHCMGDRREVFISWSGLVLCHDDCRLTLAIRCKIAEQYVESTGHSVQLSPFQRRHFPFGFKLAQWPTAVGTPWAYLVCARTLAHVCETIQPMFRGANSGWILDQIQQEAGSSYVALGHPPAHIWSNTSFASAPVTPHEVDLKYAMTTIRTPAPMYVSFHPTSPPPGLCAAISDLLRDDWKESSGEQVLDLPDIPHGDTDFEDDACNLDDWLE